MKKIFGLFLVAQMGLSGMAMAECLNPKKMTDEEKSKMSKGRDNQLACLAEARFLEPELPVTKMTSEQIMEQIKSPENDLGLVNGQELRCFFVFEEQNGQSKKFRCALKNEKGEFVDEDGKAISEAKKLITEDDEVYLADANGEKLQKSSKKGKVKEGKFYQPAILKIRYTDFGDRHVENFSSTAASRILWLLGIPAHTNIMTSKVICEGCSSDPFRNQKEPVEGVTSEFPFASVELKYKGKRLYKPTENSWAWKDINTLKKDKLSNDQVLDTEIFGLATQFLAYAGTSTMQNALVCREFNKSEDPVQHKRTCSEIVAMTHDVGGSLGRRVDKSIFEKGDKPRASLEDYQSTPIFKKGCNYTQEDSKGGLPEGLTNPARLKFLDRAQALTPERLEAIYRASSMDRVHNKDKGDDKIINAWVSATLNKIEQIKNTQCK